MDENKSALVKKIGEGNKSLSVIVAEDKLAKFKRFSQSINLSMGYLLNQAIDRYLANNSTEIFNTPTGVPTTIGTNTQSDPIKNDGIEELINTSIETYLLNNSIGYLTKTEVEELVNTTIENKVNKSSIGVSDVEEMIKTSIEVALEPVEAELEELKKAVSDRLVDTAEIAIDTTATTEDLPTTEPSPDASTIKKPTEDVERLIAKLTNDPKLKARIDSGLAQGLKGKALGQWLAEGGFLNNKSKNYDNSTLNRLKQAIEHLAKSQA